jgi:5-methyltetrahydrofolate--homocysteine methyltransferase
MNRDDLRELCGRRMLVCAGPLGVLRARGMAAPPERMALDDFEGLVEIHGTAIGAGASIVLTNTFAANGPALELLELRDSLREILRRSVQAAAQAIEAAGRQRDGTPLLALTLGPLPVAIVPRGALTFAAAIAAYREVIDAVADLTPDLIVLDSFTDLRALKAALIAMREGAPETPVAALLTFGTHGRTEDGASPAVVWAVARSLGADIVGASGEVDPGGMLPAVTAYQTVSDLPLMFQPSSLARGGEETLDPNDFLRAMRPLIEKGPAIVGVNGPHTDEWLQGLAKLCRKHEPHAPELAGRLVVTSGARDLEIGARRGIVTVGEWQATRGDALRAWRESAFRGVIESFDETTRGGVQMLEVRSTLTQTDEPEFLATLLPRLEDEFHLPLMIAAETRQGLESALESYAGRPLVSAVWDDPETLERVLPLARRYGAAVVAVCHTGGVIPPAAEERLAIAERLLQAALTAGLHQEDLIFDPVTFGAKEEGEKLRETLRTLALLKERLGQATLVRLSRVSEELPSRGSVDRSFLAMAAAVGCDLVVLNGGDKRLVESALIVSMLAGRDRKARRFLARFEHEGEHEPAAAVARPRAPRREERPERPPRESRPERPERPPRERRPERPERAPREEEEDRQPREEPVRFGRVDGNRMERPPSRSWQPRPERGGDDRPPRRGPDRSHFDREDLGPSERWGYRPDDQGGPRPRYDRERRGPSGPPRYGREGGGGRFDRERSGPPGRPPFNRERGGPPGRAPFNRERSGPPGRPPFNRERGGPPGRPPYDRDRGGPPGRPRFDRERSGPPGRPPYDRDRGGPPGRSRFDRERSDRPPRSGSRDEGGPPPRREGRPRPPQRREGRSERPRRGEARGRPSREGPKRAKRSRPRESGS